MQSFSSFPPPRQRLLVLELWGLGDVALAVPFLRTASRYAKVTLVAPPHAAPLIQRFCPQVELIPFVAPWTAFRGKYRLHRWPWLEFAALVAGLRRRRFAAAVSARPDPRDHALLIASGAAIRAGFARAGSGCLLTDVLPVPAQPHRAAHWTALARHWNWPAPTSPAPSCTPTARHIVIHTGAAQPTRRWPEEHFALIADRLRTAGHTVTLLDHQSGDLRHLIQTLATAEHFIGNDSGPGHVAALLGVPTFTIFGAQLAENFHPVHPQAAWIDGAPCTFKPCHDYCRFAEPHCIRSLDVESVWRRLVAWLEQVNRLV